MVESADREEHREKLSAWRAKYILGFSTVQRVSPLPKGCSQVNCTYKVKSSSKEFQRIRLRWELLGCRALIRECSGDPDGSDSKESACSAGDLGSTPESGRPPGERNTTHSSILAWRMPWIEEPGGLQSRVRHD